MGQGQLAFEDRGDGVDGGIAEGGGESELAEDAGCEVAAGGGAVTAHQQVEGGAHPADPETGAVEEEAAVGRHPLRGDGVQGLTQPEGGVGAAGTLCGIGP